MGKEVAENYGLDSRFRRVYCQEDLIKFALTLTDLPKAEVENRYFEWLSENRYKL